MIAGSSQEFLECLGGGLLHTKGSNTHMNALFIKTWLTQGEQVLFKKWKCCMYSIGQQTAD